MFFPTPHTFVRNFASEFCVYVDCVSITFRVDVQIVSPGIPCTALDGVNECTMHSAHAHDNMRICIPHNVSARLNESEAKDCNYRAYVIYISFIDSSRLSLVIAYIHLVSFILQKLCAERMINFTRFVFVVIAVMHRTPPEAYAWQIVVVLSDMIDPCASPAAGSARMTFLHRTAWIRPIAKLT